MAVSKRTDRPVGWSVRAKRRPLNWVARYRLEMVAADASCGLVAGVVALLGRFPGAPQPFLYVAATLGLPLVWVGWIAMLGGYDERFIGVGAEEFALEEDFALVANLQLRTDERRRQLAQEQEGISLSDLIPSPPGTVGAVALDQKGDLAAATSTGGMTNKRQGRVGDSPIIGAGTYAKNGVCAVSATGHGGYFIRAVAAYHNCCAVEYRSLSLADAAHAELTRFAFEKPLLAQVDAWRVRHE